MRALVSFAESYHSTSLYSSEHRALSISTITMPARNRGQRRPAMYNTPHIRNGGFGVLQVEAVTNRAASVQRRHLAASQLRMRDIEPDELSSSEWVRFLVMEGRERDRFISDFARQRRESSSSSSSSEPTTDMDREVAHDKAEEARLEAEDARREEQRAMDPTRSPSPPSRSGARSPGAGTTPFVSIWARHIDGIERAESEGVTYTPRRPMHARRAVDAEEAPPAYNSIMPIGEAPPAYSPTSDDEGSGPSRRSRIRRFSDQYLNRF